MPVIQTHQSEGALTPYITELIFATGWRLWLIKRTLYPHLVPRMICHLWGLQLIWRVSWISFYVFTSTEGSTRWVEWLQRWCIVRLTNLRWWKSIDLQTKHAKFMWPDISSRNNGTGIRVVIFPIDTTIITHAFLDIQFNTRHQATAVSVTGFVEFLTGR